MKRHVELYGPGLHRASHIINKTMQGDELKGLLYFFAWLIGCNDPCRQNYIHEINTDTNYDEQWTYRAHNKINKRLGKYTPTWEETQNIRIRDFIDLMEPGIWLFLMFYAKLMYSEASIALFESFFPYFLQEAPELWSEYYNTHPIIGDFYMWMDAFYREVNTLDLRISLDNVVASYDESS